MVVVAVVGGGRSARELRATDWPFTHEPSCVAQVQAL